MTETLEIAVQKVTQPVGEFFIASVEAKNLVDISFSDVRRLEGDRDVEKYLGIQRPLKIDRVKQIRKYILENRDATFPTSVILAIDEKCVEFDEASNILKLYPYIDVDDPDNSSIPFQKIAKVLDGQHRIAGFFQGSGENRSFDFDRKFELNVSIFVGISIPEQAKIFATVNLAQTKVSKSLVYDLEALAIKRNPYKTCHHVAVALDSNEESPFYHRIKRLGVATPGRVHEPLTQAAFVEALVEFISDDPSRDRNDILDGRRLKDVDIEKYPFNSLFKSGTKGDKKIYDIVFNYFDAVRKKWPNAWTDISKKGNLLPRSNAFKALMRHLKNNVYIEASRSNIGAVPSTEDFFEIISKIEISDREFTTKNFLPGSSGQSKFYKVLSGELEPSSLYED